MLDTYSERGQSPRQAMVKLNVEWTPRKGTRDALRRSNEASDCAVVTRLGWMWKKWEVEVGL